MGRNHQTLATCVCVRTTRPPLSIFFKLRWQLLLSPCLNLQQKPHPLLHSASSTFAFSLIHFCIQPHPLLHPLLHSASSTFAFSLVHFCIQVCIHFCIQPHPSTAVSPSSQHAIKPQNQSVPITYQILSTTHRASQP